jgi:hypothetical protein
VDHLLNQQLSPADRTHFRRFRPCASKEMPQLVIGRRL